MNILRKLFPRKKKKINVIAASDEAFLPHLTVMLKSAECNLDNGFFLEVYVFHNGVSEKGKEVVSSSLKNKIIKLNWIRLSDDFLKQFNVSGHVNEMTYFRILAPAVLDNSVDKAIYLDSDILIKGSLHEIWNISFEENEILACQDITVPYMNAQEGMANYEKAKPYLSKAVPLRYFKELGIPDKTKYFNGGVLVIDVSKWKSENRTKILLDHMIEFRDRNTFWDQDALNAVFWDKWKLLPPQWNQTAHIFRFPSWEFSPLNEEAFNIACESPKLIHFSTRSKPWDAECSHPLKNQYSHYYSLTAWRNYVN